MIVSFTRYGIQFGNIYYVYNKERNYITTMTVDPTDRVSGASTDCPQRTNQAKEIYDKVKHRLIWDGDIPKVLILRKFGI
jgi:hypothetical protein